MPTPQSDSGHVLQQLISALHLSNAVVDQFNGDPIKYTGFMAGFKSRILPHVTSDSDRLYQLYHLIEGEPKEMVSGALHMEASEGYVHAITMLEREYGAPHVVCNAYVTKFASLSPIQPHDIASLKRLYMLCNQCLCAMSSVAGLATMNFPASIQSVVTKLPIYLQNKWRDKVVRLYLEGEPVEFKDLVDLLHVASMAASDPIYGKEALGPKQTSQKSSSTAGHLEMSFSTGVTQEPVVKRAMKCWFCQSSHHLDDCPSFRSKSVMERKKFVSDRKLCFKCFGTGHFSEKCKAKRCSICEGRHPSSLHSDGLNDESGSCVSGFTASQQDEVEQSSSCHCKGDERALHAVLPVQVSFEGKTVQTYAFFDNGSSTSFMTDDLVKKLQVSGPTVSLKLTTMNGVKTIESQSVRNLVSTDLKGLRLGSGPCDHRFER